MVPAHFDELIVVGRVIKSRGLRGELKVESLSDYSERFEQLTTVKLELKNGEVKPFETEKIRISGRIVLLKLKGVDDRNTADTLKGAYVSVSRSEVFPLNADSFYIFELEGMDVYDPDGKRTGHVVKVVQYPANDVLIVETETDNIMIPTIKKFLREIDVEGKRIVMEVPEGLPRYPKSS